MAKIKDNTTPETGEQSPEAPPLVNETVVECEVAEPPFGEPPTQTDDQAQTEEETPKHGVIAYRCLSGVLADREYKKNEIIMPGILNDDQVNQLIGMAVLKKVGI